MKIDYQNRKSLPKLFHYQFHKREIYALQLHCLEISGIAPCFSITRIRKDNLSESTAMIFSEAVL